MNSINTKDAIALLSAYDEDSLITFQIFDDAGKGITPRHFTAHFKDVEDELLAENLKGAGIFFMVNAGDGKGRSYQNVTHIRAFVLDLDGAPLQPVWDCPALPNFIIESSPGKYQAHWLINPIAISEFKSADKAKEKFALIQTALAKRFSGDPSIKDLPRVLRVPGFYHNKATPFLTRIIRQDRFQPYDAETLIASLNLDLTAAETEHKAPLPSTNYLLQNKLKPTERHDTLTKMAYKYAHQGLDRNAVLWAIEGANKNLCNPPIDRPNEIERIVNTAIDKASKNGVGAKSPATAPKLLQAGSWAQKPIVEAEKLIPKLFDVGDKVLIVGQSKSRKSFFTLQMAMCLAMGRKFLEFDAVEPKKVLLFQFEIKEENFHSRLSRMAKKLHFDPSEPLDNLIICNARGCYNELSELQEFIIETTKQVKPQIVILDPLYKLIEGDESKSEDVKKILKYFDLLAESCKCAVAYVHHDKKGISGDQQTIDRGAGSGVLARDADAGIYLSLHASEENVLVIDFISRNNPPVKEFPVEWAESGFICSNATTSKQTTRSHKNRKVALSEWVEKAKKMIADMRMAGDFEVDMGVFNARLAKEGMNRDTIRDVKNLLIDENAIEISRQKADKGKSNKTVLLNFSTPEPAFADEFDSFGEQPF